MNGHLKTLGLGILLIVLVGIGGLVYRNAVEHPTRPASSSAPELPTSSTSTATSTI